MAHILIAYASKHGSTGEIAQAVAKNLQAAGHTADAVEIGKAASPQGYNAVVFAGPMYMGHIDGRIGKFSKRYARELGAIPVAGFVVCLAAAVKDADGMAIAEKQLHEALAPATPVAEAIFAGKLDPEKISWFQRWIMKKMNSPSGDFRDWDAINAFAKSLPETMKV